MHSKREGYATASGAQCSTNFFRSWNSSSGSIHDDEARYIQDRLKSIQADWNELMKTVSTSIGYTKDANWLAVVPITGSAAAGPGLRGTLFTAGAQAALFSQSIQGSHSKRQGAGGVAIPFDLRARSVGFVGGSFIIPSGSTGSALGSQRKRQTINISSSGSFLDLDLINPAGPNPTDGDNQKYYDIVLSKALEKAVAGLQPSLADIWGTMVGYHFLNGTTRANFYTNDSFHGSDFLWSDVPNSPAYQSHQVPFPIITVASQTAGSGSPSSFLNDTIFYEVTPIEMGSYDPRLTSWARTQYLGTHATGGKPDGDCQTGFDQASYIIGTSSSFFYNSDDGNKPNTTTFDQDASSTLELLLGKLQQQLPDSQKSRRYDVGNWPNPFKGVKAGTYADADMDWLQLGGAQDYLPIEQLLVKDRNMSVIIVFDSTGETTKNKWPDGTAVQIAANRVNNTLNASHQAFPPIPLGTDFVNSGVSLRPTFFGCYPTMLPPPYPMIIYIPNAPPVNGDDPVTNPSGFKTSYSQDHQNIFLQQAAASATNGFMPNSTQPDPQFIQCVQCAIVDRSRPSNVSRSDFCTSCFKRYCYDPNVKTTAAEITGRQFVFVDPDLKNQGFLKKHGGQLGVGIAAVVFAVAAGVIAFTLWRRSKRRHGGRGAVPVPLNTAGAKYAPLPEQGDHWSARHSYEQPQPYQQSYEMGTQPQHAHYRDPYVYNPSPGLTPNTSQYPSRNQ